MSEHVTPKLINAGADAVDEMLEGVMAAHGDKLYRPEGSPRAVVARHGPRAGKVALVIGGGSGHEPTFLGFVGKGLADAAASGTSSPRRRRSRRSTPRSPPAAGPACCSCTAITPATS